MQVHFLGVRGSTPAPGTEFTRYGGHTSSIAIAHEGRVPSLILDAGTGIRRCSALLSGEAFRGTILLSHLHWDHLHGLPFFVAGDHDDAQVAMMIPEQPGGQSALDALARGMSPPHFPIRPDELRGMWSFSSLSEESFEIDDFSVSCMEIPHKGGRTYGYRISDGRSTLVYMPDHSPTNFGPGPDGWGEYHQSAIDLSDGADLLIHDAQLVAPEHETARPFGHAVAEYAVELGRRAGVRQTALFHHRPDRTDDELDEIGLRFGDAPGVLVASESTALTL